MEKFIKLLNEYTKQSYDDYSFFKYMEPTHSFYVVDDGYESYMPEEVIFGKRFGFVSWLVENDKIDYEKVREGENSDSRWDFETIQPEYFIIMLLSVQNNPTDFLISILK